MNDNIYKLLIVFFLIDKQGVAYSHVILSLTGAVFVLPFLLFSASSGTLADRFSKRNIIVITKILELLSMAIGLLAFAFESIIVSYITLFLMATQSAIFGPSKYGIIPEIVTTDRISGANGLLTSFTFLAIIVGTFLASFITDITGRNFILASLFCTIVALAGVITSFGIHYTPPSGSQKRFNIWFLKEIANTLKIAKTIPSLLPAIVGSAFFLFLGAFLQLNIIPFAVQSLHMTDVQGGYLFLITALGIGTGSVLAGKISGKTVELGLVPVAAAGITCSLFLLDYYGESLWMVAPLVIVTGILGGLYQVPLDSYIQISSPNDERGQVVAATNVLSFTGVLLASALIYVLTAVFDLSADKGFTVMGFIAAGVAIFFGYQFFDYLTRFVGMLFARLQFNASVEGVETLPETPVIFICNHTAWNDMLLILGAQRRRIRFFIEEKKERGRFYKFFRFGQFSKDAATMQTMAKFLKRGISVCILTENKHLKEEIQQLHQISEFKDLSLLYPLISVDIKKEAQPEASRFKTLAKRLHIPAFVCFKAE